MHILCRCVCLVYVQCVCVCVCVCVYTIHTHSLSLSICPPLPHMSTSGIVIHYIDEVLIHQTHRKYTVLIGNFVFSWRDAFRNITVV